MEGEKGVRRRGIEKEMEELNEGMVGGVKVRLAEITPESTWRNAAGVG